ncbi:hypothetical protein GCM10010401_11490 [Rarobacter faecitabidus]|uniref:Uncharacterized protein n=1 Tax=Rarobacter faecitabidus TaxID=13243 RepID=A0A542ZP27_RARFA|nr:hypothetical protein [Rarobacter faecitabidus]TQL62113.1 hypothetical protein FB461_1749 [Rarobacter faecitabidus]
MEDIYTALAPAEARDLAHDALWNEGWTVTKVDHWTADAERGSVGATVILGPLAGDRQQHVKFRLQVFARPGGGTAVRVRRFTSADIGKSGAKRNAELVLAGWRTIRTALPEPD